MEIEIVSQLPESLRVPILYEKDGTTKIGELTNCIECLVEEERNGIFEVSIIYPTTDSIFNSLEEESIIVCNANDTLLNQKFRIYMTRKLMSNKIEVFARHISFDLAYDTVNSIDITNQSCEYALNTIFRQSQFSTHYKGYSDIINAQDYKISMCNCIEAIAGKEGSIVDTYGTGAEILRDNTNIYVKNRRGNDNLVSIEYAKNLTGFELEEDTTDLITRIMPYAKYNNSETNEEIMIKGNAVDSPLINNYSHPYISYIDYSDKFEEGETPTTSKLTEFAKAEYRDNKVDIPKQNYKIEFVPLSKCVGYEGLEDEISLCDTVTIKDTRYNIDTKAKVIRTVYDVLKDRYDSMELGEPRTTLGDIIGGSGEDGVIGPQGPQGPAGNNGIDGKTTYFHIKYSNIANPTEPSQITETPSTYIGTYVDFTEKDSTDPKKYTWSRFEGLQGKNGEQGIPGTNGIDGKTTYLHIKYSNDGGKTFTSNNGETVGEWMGTYTDFNINDSRNPTDYKWVKIKGEQGIQGPVGADGKTTYTWIKYADTPSSGMSDFPEGKEYIGIAYNKTTATESNNYSDYSWSLIKGSDGVQGPQGPQGEATYTWIKYADSPTSGMSDDPTNKIYMGIAYNKTTKKESTNYSDYSWSLIRGPQGPQGEQGIPGPQGPPGQDGNMENFPNTLPSIPVLSSKVYGFSTIELSWTFENKVYYQYELYASKTKDFKPNTFDLIHAGQTSSFLFQAKPNETWYFRVCAINTHGNRTAFSSQVTVTTKKVDDLSNYVDNMAIGEALIGELSLDRGWVGKLNANYLDVKGNFSVTDGNGKRTFDIDSFGNVNLDVNQLNIRGESAASKSDLKLTEDNLTLKFTSIGQNLIQNGDARAGIRGWTNNSDGGFYTSFNEWFNKNYFWCTKAQGFTHDWISLKSNTDYVYSALIYTEFSSDESSYPLHFWCNNKLTDGRAGAEIIDYDLKVTANTWKRCYVHFRTTSDAYICFKPFVYGYNHSGGIGATEIMLHEGSEVIQFTPKPDELYNEIMQVDNSGINVLHEDKSRTNLNSKALDFYDATNSKYASVNGGIYKFWGNGKMVGDIGRNKWTGTNNYLCAINSTFGNQSVLGASMSSDSEYYNAFVVVSGVDAQPDTILYHKGVTLHSPHVGGSLKFYHAEGMVDFGSKIYGSSSYFLTIAGHTGINISVENGNEVWNIIKVTNNWGNNPKGVVDFYGPLNMNGWTITNSKAVNTLDSISPYSRKMTKDIKDIFGVYSLTDGDIRYTDRQVYHTSKVDDCFECYVELPYYLAENIENNYHVNISKRGFGDYRIKEINQYYFILESDRDGFAFTFEIVAKKIEKADNNVIVANYSVEQNNKECNNEPYQYSLEETEYWRLYSKETYISPFLGDMYGKKAVAR